MGRGEGRYLACFCGLEDGNTAARSLDFDMGARAELLLLLVADIVMRAVIFEKFEDLFPRCSELIAGATSFIGFRAHRVHAATEKAPLITIIGILAVFALFAREMFTGALPHF